MHSVGVLSKSLSQRVGRRWSAAAFLETEKSFRKITNIGICRPSEGILD
jgi:hypothetical protein